MLNDLADAVRCFYFWHIKWGLHDIPAGNVLSIDVVAIVVWFWPTLYVVGNWCNIRTFSDAVCSSITSGRIFDSPVTSTCVFWLSYDARILQWWALYTRVIICRSNFLLYLGLSCCVVGMCIVKIVTDVSINFYFIGIYFFQTYIKLLWEGSYCLRVNVLVTSLWMDWELSHDRQLVCLSLQTWPS